MSDTEKIVPFANGTQYGTFKIRNCDRCKKGYSDEVWHCELEEALDVASFDDGYISVEIGKRMGAVQSHGYYSWGCPEFQPKGVQP